MKNAMAPDATHGSADAAGSHAREAARDGAHDGAHADVRDDARRDVRNALATQATDIGDSALALSDARDARAALGVSEPVAKLLDVVQQLSMARSLDDVQRIVRRAARELTGADGATFVLRDGDRCHYADEDAIAPLWKGLRFPMSACISGWAMLHKRAAVIEDIYADPRIPADAYRPTFVKSLAMVPIRASDPIGAIGNYWATRRRPSDAEVALLQALADSTSIALANVALLDELRAAKVAAEAANRLKDEFLTTISHELRTPLHPILAWSSLLLEGAVSEAEQPEALREIHEHAKLELRQVETLLDMSRIVSGGAQLELADAELAPIVETAIESLAAAASAKQIALERALDGLDEPLCLDARRVLQIAWNLLSNAIKFTPRGGRVRIALERDGEHAKLVVSDSGEGIQPDFAPHIFERFRQENATSTRTSSGMGLGLALVRHLVELHGGRVEASSAGKGRGATFTVRLPLARCARAAA